MPAAVGVQGWKAAGRSGWGPLPVHLISFECCHCRMQQARHGRWLQPAVCLLAPLLLAGCGHGVSLPRAALPAHRPSPCCLARRRPSLAGVVEAGWTHAAGMLYRKYQIAMGGHILDPTEVRCTACRSAAQLEAVSLVPAGAGAAALAAATTWCTGTPHGGLMTRLRPPAAPPIDLPCTDRLLPSNTTCPIPHPPTTGEPVRLHEHASEEGAATRRRGALPAACQRRGRAGLLLHHYCELV